MSEPPKSQKSQPSDPGPEPRVVMAYVSDLYFVSRIEVAAKHFGWEAKFVSSGPGEELRGVNLTAPAESQKAEGLSGDESDLAANLVIVDLNQAGSVDWISKYRTQVGDVVPVIAFGSHVEADILAAARQAGADRAVARSRFVEILPGLFE